MSVKERFDALPAIRSGAQGWLQRQWELHDWTSVPVDTVLQWLVAAGLCREYGAPDDLLGLAEERLRHIWSGQTSEALADAGQPRLLILAARLLKRAGLEARPLSEAVCRLADEEATLDPADREDPSVLELLLMLGHLPSDAVRAQLAGRLRPPQAYVHLPLEEIHQQCLIWSLLTDYGAAAPDPEVAGLTADYEEPISALALCLLRHQQLDAGGELLRVLAYLNKGAVAREEGAAFLTFQQRLDGCFGYQNPLTATKNPYPDERSRDLFFHLPLTMAALHTLGELSQPGHRLYRLVRGNTQ